jgi:O-antigen/teichoic acid export membrane protein
MQNSKINILGHVFRYTGSQYVSQFIGFFTSVFIRRFLGPFNMGIWTMLKVVMSYVHFLYLGTTHTVFYKIPFLIGQGNKEEAENVKNVVFSYLMAVSFVGAGGILSYAFLYKNTLNPSMFKGLVAVSVLILCQRIYTYCIMLLRANKKFSILSLSIIFDAILNLVLVLTLVRSFRLNGLLITVICVPVINVLFIKYFIKLDLRFQLKIGKLFAYIKFGFPLFIKSMLGTILKSIDSIMIASFLGLQALGVYSIALLTRNYGEGLSTNINVVITPHFLEDYGKRQNLYVAEKYLKTSAEVMSVCMAFMLSLIYIVSPVFITYFLPKFTPGVTALRVMLLTTFFTTASPQSSHFLVAMNKQSRLVIISLIVIMMNIILNLIFLSMNFGIVGVASATAISSFVAFFITLFYSLSHIEGIKKGLLFIALVLAPILYACLAIFIIEYIVVFPNVILSTIIQSALFFTVFLPWAFKINKRIDLFNMIKTAILNKLSKLKR